MGVSTAVATPAPDSGNALSRFVGRHTYFFVKLLRAVLTAFLVLVLSFVLVRASGNPGEIFLGSEATPEAVELFNRRWGLDQPLPVQFARYFERIVRFDLGKSLVKGRPVAELIGERVGATLSLMAPAAVMSIGLGVFFGLVAALRHRRLADTGILVASTLGFSLPNFFFGVLLIFVFSVVLGVLPSSGNTSLRHYIMPLIAIITSDVAVFVRFSRSALLDILDRDFITSFRALGTKERRVLMRHALPNASIALLTISGFYIGSLVGGAIVTETIFSWPGLGSLLVASVRARDFPLVQALVLIFGMSIVVANLIVDVLYGVVDPRIRKGVDA